MPTTQDVLDAALAKIIDGYVFADRAAELAAGIRRNSAEGAYDDLSGRALCEKVTEDLQAICQDKHLRLLWDDEAQEMEEEEGSNAGWLAMCHAENYGVNRVERLADNIGYLELTLISEPDLGQRAFAAAMELVSGTRALVIDLRGNRGGSPAGVALWCSYLFPNGDVHVNDIYQRSTDLTRQFWTSGHVAGPRYLDRPVRVLTSSRTFSGGEELAYDLQALGRAVLIGETTRGGAHPTEYYQLTPHITVTVPNSRSINPVTGTNWEGIGVVPDIAVPAEEALELALTDLRKELAQEPVEG
jgi:C-terminal processing protease CtpA/Prc